MPLISETERYVETKHKPCSYSSDKFYMSHMPHTYFPGSHETISCLIQGLNSDFENKQTLLSIADTTYSIYDILLISNFDKTALIHIHMHSPYTRQAHSFQFFHIHLATICFLNYNVRSVVGVYVYFKMINTSMNELVESSVAPFTNMV